MDVTGGYGQIGWAVEFKYPARRFDVCGREGGRHCYRQVRRRGTDLYVVRNWRGGSQAFEVFPSVYPMNQADKYNIAAETRIEGGGSLVGTVKMMLPAAIITPGSPSGF